MRQVCVAIVMMSALSVFSSAQQIGDHQAKRWTLRFEDYPATEKLGKKATLRIPKDWRTFRTRLRWAYDDSPNFAGVYAVAGWGCGSGCLAGAVVNQRLGTVIGLPIRLPLVVPWESDDQRPWGGFVAKRSSRLLIVDGCPAKEGSDDYDPKECGTRYFEFADGKFKLLRFEPDPPKAPESE